jgi:hypothetical protein
VTGREFPIGDVLSVTTGVLVSRQHIGGVYEVCDYMTGAANFTHQLPRVSAEITPAIHQQHPWLADISVPDWDMEGKSRDEVGEIVFAWLDSIEAEHGLTVTLEPLAAYVAQDPIEEACDMVGAEKVFVVDPAALAGGSGDA